MTVISTAFQKTISLTAASRRLRMDAFELAACILGARATERMVRHGHIRPWLPNHKLATRRLLAKLEWMSGFRRELPEAGIPVPPEAQLRDLVKRALRMARRFVVYYGLKTAREHHDLLQDRIWKFVANRCQDSER